MKTRALLILSTALLAIVSLSMILASSSGWTVTYGWEFKPGSSGLIHYTVGDELNYFDLRSDKLVISHSTGIWGFMLEGDSMNITQLASNSNDYVTILSVSASSGTWSNTTLYWPSVFSDPDAVNVTIAGNTTHIPQADFYTNKTAFDEYWDGPAVYLNSTGGYIIVKTQHSSVIQIAVDFPALTTPTTATATVTETVTVGGGGGGAGFFPPTTTVLRPAPAIPFQQTFLYPVIAGTIMGGVAVILAMRIIWSRPSVMWRKRQKTERKPVKWTKKLRKKIKWPKREDVI